MTCKSIVICCLNLDSIVLALTLTSEIKSFPLSFSKKFKETFPLESPFQSQKLEQCSKSLFSNLIGGIGYFYGDYLVDSSYAEEYEEMGERFWEDAEEARRRNKAEVTSPVQLFSSIPSRTFFPRGFLWDEGFHLLPILEWDQDLAYVFGLLGKAHSR